MLKKSLSSDVVYKHVPDTWSLIQHLILTSWFATSSMKSPLGP